MTLLRQRFLEDMQLRNLAPTTQRSYIHYVAEYAKYYQTSPDRLGLDDVRTYQLHLVQERRLSPASINSFVSAVQFLYLVTLEMPWERGEFTRMNRGPGLAPQHACANVCVLSSAPPSANSLPLLRLSESFLSCLSSPRPGHRMHPI